MPCNYATHIPSTDDRKGLGRKTGPGAKMHKARTDGQTCTKQEQWQLIRNMLTEYHFDRGAQRFSAEESDRHASVPYRDISSGSEVHWWSKARVYQFRSETGCAHPQHKMDRMERRQPPAETLKNFSIQIAAGFLCVGRFIGSGDQKRMQEGFREKSWRKLNLSQI